MQTFLAAPTPNSYWVQSGLLLAGEHPGSSYPVKARQTLQRLLEACVTVFIDLTEEGEYYGYEQLALREGSALKRLIACYNLPVKDEAIPSPPEMVTILDTIDTAIAARRTVYLHCLHGRGRTGTVVGCYLVRHGLSGEAALDEILRLRADMQVGKLLSPAHVEQRNMILNWSVGK